ncbi:MAG: T9SS type A sorting domain-containing protein [Bacteroidota bacterium]
MKNLLLFLCLSLSFSPAWSQNLTEKVLSTDLKMALSDGVRLEDGSWMFSAFANSITPGDSSMAMVVKTDSSFSLLWAKRYKYLRRDDFSCITKLSDGNVIVGGTMRQSFSLENGGSLYKLDTAGNVIWHLFYDDSSDDRVENIFEQADSSLVIFIRKGVSNNPTKIIHASQEGNIISQREYTLADNQSLGLLADEVVADENEQYYFTGSVSNQGVQEAYVCALDDNTLLWYKRFRFADRSTSSFKIAYDPMGQSLFIAGGVPDTIGIFTNIWLAKLDLMGNMLWAKEYGGPLRYTEFITGIYPQANGDILLSGSVFNDNGSDGYLMRLDATGNKLWEKGYKPNTTTFSLGAFLLADGRMLLNGNSGTAVYLMTTDTNGQSACSSKSITLDVADLSAEDSTYALTVSNPGILKVVPPVSLSDVVVNDSLLCMSSVSIEKRSLLTLTLYPNPAQDQLTVVLPDGFSQSAACVVVDAFGRTLSPDMKRSPREIQINISDLAKGIYWVNLSADGQTLSRTFVRY